jgi:hypothetical protein
MSSSGEITSAKRDIAGAGQPPDAPSLGVAATSGGTVASIAPERQAT